ncbi:MAG TPA: LON peptidase substrate-binding domain-containing protein, partial [Spirochaetia bacterium]|nr:LON peptidase substrate-binding domain-containing protein [Spirochaetia bacterium]
MEEILLPLFPLELVLLPEEPLPLHIFEDRYREMIGQCLRAKTSGIGGQDFGVVLAKGQEISNVGCTARIVSLTREYDDGRMDILTVGRRRFEVLLTNEEKSYLRASVEFFDDEGSDTPGDTEAESAIQLFQEVMRRLHQTSDVPVHLSQPYRCLSFRLAAVLPLALDFKQQLLSLRNEPERLQQVVHSMRQLSHQIEVVQVARKKAGGNGDVRR